MIDTRLIWYKHYYHWADELIATLNSPPQWILEIATIKYYPDAVVAVNRFVYAEPFASFDLEECADEYVACIFLRNQSGATSWATFLSDAGSYADGNGGRYCCEHFYEMLNVLEDSEYSLEVQHQQQVQIETQFTTAITRIRPIYGLFKNYFREYVAQQS